MTNWGKILLILILGVIIILNIKPGYLILGNDNFSPELNPSLTLERSVFSPAWRAYRVMGIPSDSEQADIFRTFLFFTFEKVLPVWAVSQGYLFFTFFIASYSMASLVALLINKLFTHKFYQLSFLLGGIFYTANLLTSWIYFFPVQLFVAAYAFLPLVLWRLVVFFEKQSIKNIVLLLLSSLLLSTSALTATMFFVCTVIVLVFFVFLFLEHLAEFKFRKLINLTIVGLIITLGIQLFWLAPFFTYIKTNTPALRDSAIYRDITATTIENELRHNTLTNTVRYYSSWMDTKEDSLTFTFPYRDWYKKSILANLWSFIPLILALIGSILIIKRKSFWVFPAMFFIGWFLIKGANPPLGFFYSFIQDNFPIVAQVFRWQSSKLWPFLAISIPFLATFGSVVIFKKLIDQQRSILKGLFLLFLLLGLLGFIYPYFKGDLIRNKVFVKPPEEYFELAKYLDKQDKDSRIYLAPEANTLYFRNYSWGFWGSVVLNYILPNPIVEKALITGSYENEQAFTVLNNAYYSEDPAIFTSALKRYQTPFILSDKYATKGDVGYPYNWDVHQKVVDNNPYFEKIWEKGQLSLYKIKDYNNSQSAAAIYANTDFTKLNTILSSYNLNDSYYSADKTPGIIFPFTLKFDKVEVTNDEIIGKLTNQQAAIDYNLVIEREDLDSSPTKISYVKNNKELIITPLFPSFIINGKPYILQLPTKHYKLNNFPSFVTVGQQVIDNRYTSEDQNTSTVAYQDIDKLVEIKAWGQEFGQIDFARRDADKPIFSCSNGSSIHSIKAVGEEKVNCSSLSLQLGKDSIAEVEMSLTSNNPTQVLLCIESNYKKSCVNRNSSALVNGRLDATMLIPTIFLKGDTFKIYLDFNQPTSINRNTNDALISLDKLSVKIYSSNEAIKKVEDTQVAEKQFFLIPINKNDLLELHIPILKGQNTNLFKSDGLFIPETSTVPLEKNGFFESKIDITPNEGLRILNQESTSSIFPKILFLEPGDGIAMLALSAKNSSGIPLDIFLRDIGSYHKLWTKKLFYKTSTETFDLFKIPSEVRSYYLEVFSTGLGPRASQNSIQGALFQILPKTWVNLKLTPVNLPDNTFKLISLNPRSKVDTKSIVSIPTAYSPNWVLDSDNNLTEEQVKIDGWQQGWRVEREGKLKASFWPNNLSYLGYLPLLGVIGWLLVKTLKERFYKKT